MRTLDLFCGAGGAAMGLHRAFPDAEIIGVDIKPQPHYPFTFVLADAMTYPLEGFDFYWASCPCQRYSTLTKWWGANRVMSHPDLIAETRQRLAATGKPYTIENVVGAPLVRPILLCGSMFNLHVGDGGQLRRHRIFEVPWFNGMFPVCQHNGKQSVAVYGHSGGSSKRDGIRCHPTADRRIAMGIDWMTGNELSEAIPPAYSEWIGQQFREGNK